MNTHDKIVKCRSCGYVGQCDPTCCEHPDYDGATAEEAYQAALASPEVQKQPQHKTLLQVWRSTDSCGEFWSWDEADQYDYDRALPENRRIIQIIKEG